MFYQTLAFLLVITVVPHPLEELRLPNTDTAIVDSGASGIYLTPAAPYTDINTAAPPVNMGTSSGTCYSS